MEQAEQAFDDAIKTAMSEAKKTGNRYFVLYPYIANLNSTNDMTHLVVPVVHEDFLEGEKVAFTVYPHGAITYGNTKIYK